MPRFSTNDSVTMQSMQVDSSQLKSPRRGKRGAVQKPQTPPPPQRGVARFSTGDSVTMQSMRHHDSSANSPTRRGGKREAVQGLEHLTQSPPQSPGQQHVPPPGRGVARFSTGDSVTMQSMRQDPSASSPCRGGKREAIQGQDQLVRSPQQAPPQRGVPRFSTGDRVTMHSMQHDSGARSPRRGGKRGEAADDLDQLTQTPPQQAPPQRGGTG